MNGFCHKRGQGFKHRQYTPTESFLNAPARRLSRRFWTICLYVSAETRKFNRQGLLIKLLRVEGVYSPEIVIYSEGGIWQETSATLKIKQCV